MFMFALKQGIGAAPVPGLGEGVSSIQGILSDADISGRATAALLLGRDKDPDVLPALRDALSDKDASVRAAAALDRGSQRSRAPQGPDSALRGQKESVRLRAAAGYLRLAYVKAQDESAKARVLKPRLPLKRSFPRERK
jgi:hypothetical protein